MKSEKKLPKNGHADVRPPASRLLDGGWVDKPGLATELRCSVPKIDRMSREVDGLPFAMLGGKRIYNLGAVNDWLMKRMVRPNPSAR